MKKIKLLLQTIFVTLTVVPVLVFASAVINVDLGNGRQSLCKPVGEVTVNEEHFDNDVSINILPSDYIYFNNTTSTITIRAIAANTGDTSANVNYSIKYNGTPGVMSTTHSFTVTVDGKTQPITVNTSPELTKIEQMDTYSLARFAKGVPGTNDIVYNESEITPMVENYTINLPASGTAFGNSFKQYGCSGYTDFVFEASKQPVTWAFEQGITNAYTVTKKTAVSSNTCDLTFTANPTLINLNSGTPSTLLSWNATGNGSGNCTPAKSCSAANGWSSSTLSPSGSLQFFNFTNPVAGGSQLFEIICNYANTSKTASATVNFVGNAGPSQLCNVTLDASPNSVFPGSSVNIYWSATGNTNSCVPANYCLAQSDWAYGSLQNQGNRSYTTSSSATGSQTFAVKCYYPQSEVREANDYITYQTNTQQYGYPTIDASPASVYPGNQVNIVWSGGNGATSCYALDAWATGTLNPNGTKLFTTSPNAAPGSSLAFQIRCSYPDGTTRDATDSISFLNNTITPPVIPPVIIPPNSYTNPSNSGTSGIAGSPIVRTLAVRSVEKKSAKLRGYFNANGCPAISTWFEYSDDKQNLDLRSDAITQSNKYGNVEFVATNLQPDTKYYYRIVGENCKGTSLGAIESFRTAKGGVYTEGADVGVSQKKVVVKQSTTTAKVVDNSVKAVGAGTSYLRLDVTNDNDIPDNDEPLHTVIRGEVVVYRVVWENLTMSVLHDGKIRVNLPKSLSFMNSSNGIYDKDSHSVYMTIGDITGRASGVEFITVQVTTNGEVGDPVIVEAIAAFDAPGSDAQVNATDFDEDILGDRNVSAAVTPAFGGFGNWMWFVGLFLLLVLVFLIARYHTLASQYRGGYASAHHGGYQPAYTPPPVVPRSSEPERDTYVPPSSLPTESPAPVYKPYNPNSL